MRRGAPHPKPASKSPPKPPSRPSSKTTPEPARVSALPIFVGLAVLTIAAFARVAGNAFLELDDRAYVADNPRVVAGLTAKGIAWAFERAHAANYHPLTLLSHLLDCELFGMSAAGHHLT